LEPENDNHITQTKNKHNHRHEGLKWLWISLAGKSEEESEGESGGGEEWIVEECGWKLIQRFAHDWCNAALKYWLLLPRRNWSIPREATFEL